MKHLFLLAVLISTVIACKTKMSSLDQDSPVAEWQSVIGDIRDVDIRNLHIDLFEGLPTLTNPDIADVDNIVIGTATINLDSSRFHYDRSNKKMIIQYVRVDTLVRSVGGDKADQQLPYNIKSLTLANLRLVKNGQEIGWVKSQTPLTRFTIDNYTMESSLTSPLRSRLDSKVADLENRIIILLDQIAKLIHQVPDHAARNLPPTFRGYLERVRAIKSYYAHREDKLVGASLRVDLDELKRIEFPVERAETELHDPANYPQEVSNELLFATAEYNIHRNVPKLNTIVLQLENEIASVRRAYPDQHIQVSLAVTGYADEQEIGSGLFGTLQGLYPDTTRHTDENHQAFANRLLSQARADAVEAYLKNHIAPATVTAFDYKNNSALGKGWTYPVQLTRPCPDSCQQRRIVYVSSVVLPTEQRLSAN